MPFGACPSGTWEPHNCGAQVVEQEEAADSLEVWFRTRGPLLHLPYGDAFLGRWTDVGGANPSSALPARARAVLWSRTRGCGCARAVRGSRSRVRARRECPELVAATGDNPGATGASSRRGAGGEQRRGKLAFSVHTGDDQQSDAWREAAAAGQ